MGNKEQNFDKLLTTKQAAAFIGVSYTTLTRWRFLKNPFIPYFNIKSRYFYRYGDLVLFLEKNYNKKEY